MTYSSVTKTICTAKRVKGGGLPPMPELNKFSLPKTEKNHLF